MIDSPLRSAIIDLLDEVLTPIMWAELDALLAARYSLSISEDQFSAILTAERQCGAGRGADELLLLPGLRVPDAVGDTRYMTRSDWAVKMRLTGEALEPSRSLLMIRWMCDQLVVAKQAGSDTWPALEREIYRAAEVIPEEVIEEYKDEMAIEETSGSMIEVIRNSAEDLASESRRNFRDLTDRFAGKFSRLSPGELAFGL